MLCKLFYLDVVEVTPPEEKELVYSEAEDGKPKSIPVAEFVRYFRNKSSNGAIVLRDEFKVRGLLRYQITLLFTMCTWLVLNKTYRRIPKLTER